MVKFTSTMQKPCIHYRPMLKLTEKKKFLAKIFFRPGPFWMFSKREMKKWDFLTFGSSQKWFPLTEYTIYIHRLKIWRIIQNMKKTELDYLVCTTCDYKSKKIILEKQGVLFFCKRLIYIYINFVGSMKVEKLGLTPGLEPGT